MKKGLKAKISSFLTAIIMSGSFVFAPIGLGGLDIEPLFSFRDPAAPQILTYEDNKLYIDGVATSNNTFPAGDYQLGGDIVLTQKMTFSSGSTSIDLAGHNMVEQVNGTDGSVFLISGGTFTLSDSTFDFEAGTGGSFSSTKRGVRAFDVRNSAELNITGGYIEGFSSASIGGCIVVEYKEANANVKINMSGGVIRDCATTAGSGGGAIAINYGTFTMSGYALVTECKNNCSSANEKNGNGAGISVANKAHMIMKDHASVTNCTGKGYHGAGIDFWGTKYTCTLEISGSPVITGNICGKGYANNLYCGKSITVGKLDLTRENGEVVAQVGITIQQSPIFTMNIKANNPDETIEDLSAFFFADRVTAGDLVPNSSTYDIDPTDDRNELKQTPTIKATCLVPSVSEPSGYKTVGVVECVPIGYIESLPNYSAPAYHSFSGWNTQSGKFTANFKVKDTTTGSEDFNLYAVVLPTVAGYSLSSFEDGSMGLNCYISYNADLGFINANATANVTGFTSDPNPSSTYTIDASDIKTIGNYSFVHFTFKFNPYDMTKQFQETITFANGYKITASQSPAVIGRKIVDADSPFGTGVNSDNAKWLASSMLTFGAKLQAQLGYYKEETEDPNAAYATYGVKNLKTHDAITSLSGVPEKSVVDDESNALTFYGSSVVYNTNIEIKQYIKLNGENASDYTYSIDGQGSYAFETDNSGKYIFARVKVPAYSMDKSYEFTVKDGSGATVLTINYSIYNYIDSVLTNKQGTTIYDTVQALYWYGVDAKAYAGV